MPFFPPSQLFCIFQEPGTKETVEYIDADVDSTDIGTAYYIQEDDNQAVYE